MLSLAASSAPLPPNVPVAPPPPNSSMASAKLVPVMLGSETVKPANLPPPMFAPSATQASISTPMSAPQSPAPLVSSSTWTTTSVSVPWAPIKKVMPAYHARTVIVSTALSPHAHHAKKGTSLLAPPARTASATAKAALLVATASSATQVSPKEQMALASPLVMVNLQLLLILGLTMDALKAALPVWWAVQLLSVSSASLPKQVMP